MEDIFKSGALGLTTLALLIYASASSNELENSENYSSLNEKEEIPVVDTINVVEKDELKSKKDIHIPL